jgi:6-phosphofructokinase 1
MITFKRVSDNPYKIEIDMAKLSDVANDEKPLPEEWITEDGFFVTKDFYNYALPLIQGEAPIRIKDGLPSYIRFKKHWVKL